MSGTFDLGDFIREQRRTAQISVRQLAKLAGVSNPYLSQIERGLRRPSAEILQLIAKGLRISAEALYVQAGILDERIAGGVVVDAVLADTTLTERQKQVMLEVYDSFRKENQRREADAAQFPTAREASPFDEDFPDDDPPPPPVPLRTTMARINPRKAPR